MLYLMMSKTDKEFLVKVGYSKGGTTQRRRQYYGYNPRAIMRSSCAGPRSTELQCHKQLAECGTRIQGTEWFSVPSNVFDVLYKEGMAAFRPNHKPIHFLEEFK